MAFQSISKTFKALNIRLDYLTEKIASGQHSVEAENHLRAERVALLRAIHCVQIVFSYGLVQLGVFDNINYDLVARESPKRPTT
jgi:hypothetical protein